jgi:hypothetical protein
VKSINLQALRADNPLGAMAAFGCLRVVCRSERLRGSKLGWKQDGGSFHAVLHTDPRVTVDEFINILVEDVQRARDRAELMWADQIKGSTEELFRESASGASPETAAWFAAFGSDLVLNEGALVPTPFDMSVARQRFLADARVLMGALAEPKGKKATSTSDSYREALFGPWLYRDDQHSLGWDPSTLKMGAFTFKAPTAMANAGVRAAVWLAFESLPLFPCVYQRGLATRSFFRPSKREAYLRWPIWAEPISLQELETLLGWEELVKQQPDEEQLRLRGVLAVYSSAKYKPNKYLASFRAPELAAGHVLSGAS